MLEYDGTDFHGWQVQPGRRTVQGELERVLGKLLDRPVRVRGAGRTDRGVHARGQVAAVDVSPGWTAERVGRALPAVLPADVVLRAVTEEAAGFDPRRRAKEREYQYLIGKSPSALRGRYRWWVRWSLDTELMAGAARLFEGRHDFRAFTVEAGARDSTELELRAATLHEGNEEIALDFRAPFFLRRMVRLMVGTLVDVGRGRLEPRTVSRALAHGDRGCVGTAAPPHGLYLMRVGY